MTDWPTASPTHSPENNRLFKLYSAMQSNDRPSPELEIPGLPNELVIYIFKLASATSREFCRSLCLVSSWTRDIVLPFLLTTVILNDVPKVERFIEYLSQHRDRALFVRNLWLPSPDSGSDTNVNFGTANAYDVEELLQSCPRVVNLAVVQLPKRGFISKSCFQDGLRVTLHAWVHRSVYSCIWTRLPTSELPKLTFTSWADVSPAGCCPD
jgi:hypothetical protein